VSAVDAVRKLVIGFALMGGTRKIKQVNCAGLVHDFGLMNFYRAVANFKIVGYVLVGVALNSQPSSVGS
jgi:hypothetical protein